jgi:hypothetical protein
VLFTTGETPAGVRAFTTLVRMPLTLSHPAAVLPLRRLGLPVTVLVTASMVPDLPLFLGTQRGYRITHGPVGIVTIDVVLAVVAVAGWTFIVRDALVDMAPAPVRRRLPARARLTRTEWLLAPVAAVVGAATHVAWDAFTHPGAWGVRRIDWLQSEHAGLVGASWAQYASGIVGLVVVIGAAAAYLRSSTVTRDARPRVLPAPTLPVVVGIAAVTAIASAARSAPRGLHAMAFDGVVDSLIVLAVGLTVISLAWHVAGMRRARHGLKTA